MVAIQELDGYGPLTVMYARISLTIRHEETHLPYSNVTQLIVIP